MVGWIVVEVFVVSAVLVDSTVEVLLMVCVKVLHHGSESRARSTGIFSTYTVAGVTVVLKYEEQSAVLCRVVKALT